MPSAYSAALEGLTTLAKYFIGALIGAIVVITLASVWWRYVLNAPLAWPEQVSRIFFVWVTFVGAAVLYRERLHVAIDMFVMMLPVEIQRLAGWVIEAIVFVFNVVLFIFGLKLSLDTLGQTYGALDITPAVFYFAAPVSAGLMILYLIEELINPARRKAVRVTSGASTS
jgi:TRAP-type C4-dicarboxylate transport system permease small subunit